MKKNLLIIYAAFLLLGLAAGDTAWADSYQQEPSDIAADYSGNLFTPEELDDLLSPIALYPDPLLAQVLPAATFNEQIDEAGRYVGQYGKSARIDDQPWDVSVKAVAHYPDVLFMMDQKSDWTVALGQAFVNQPQDVMDAIQRLRAQAMEAGNLVSTAEQQVVVEEGVIKIVPAEPAVIYVPQYDPMVVYMEPPYPSYGFITFGIGFAIGPWLNRDCDWHRHRIYYHGWHGGGWIGRARPHIHVWNNVYINNHYSDINVNKRVIHHDTTRYREEIRRDVQNHRESIGRPAPPPRVDQSRPVPSENRPQISPGRKDVFRGRDIQKSQPMSQSGYGGYGTGKDAAKYRERGQSSRENMNQYNRQQQIPVRSDRPGPTQQPGYSGGRQPAPGPTMRSAPSAAPPASRGGGGQQRQR